MVVVLPMALSRALVQRLGVDVLVAYALGYACVSRMRLLLRRALSVAFVSFCIPLTETMMGK